MSFKSVNGATPHALPPQWLAEIPCWLLHEEKRPYYVDGTPRRGPLDSPEDRAALVTYDEALEALAHFPGYGLGVALGEYNGQFLQGIDIDKLDAHPELAKIVPELPGYLEYSPSKNGIHALGMGVHFRSMGSNGTGIEAYCKARYFTFTGQMIRSPESPEDLSSHIDTVLRPVHSGCTMGESPTQAQYEAITGPIDLTEEQIADLESALHSIPADQYKLWTDTGLALKSCGEKGFALWNAWSATAEDEYDEGEALGKWDSFNPTAIDYRAVFAEAQRRGWQNPRKGTGSKNKILIEELNQRHAIVRTGSKTRILDDNGEEFSFMDVRDFELMYANRAVELDEDKGKTVSLGKYWVQHPDRRAYLGGVTFDPTNRCSEDKFNLWRGFDILPNGNASCELLIDHIKNVICNGDKATFIYLLNWMAYAVQHPEKAPGVAVCLLSEQGAGKGIFVDYFSAIFGRHFAHLTQRSHLVGQFTGFLQDKVLIFADELIWAGNKQETSILKGMLTEPTRTVERKYLDPITVPNYTHLIIASNERFAVPAEVGDRRFFVLEVSPTKRGDHQYFKAIVEEAENGGRQALLYYLMHVDLSEFNPANFPKTAARLEQQLLNLEGVEKWLYERLYFGTLGPVDGEFLSPISLPIMRGSAAGTWPKYAEKQVLYEQYCEWSLRTNQRRHPEPIKIFSQTLASYGVDSARPGSTKQSMRPHCYRFPSLSDIRQRFEERLGHTINWGDKGEEANIADPPPTAALFAING